METRPLPGIPFDAQRRRRAGDVWDEAKAGLDFLVHNLPRAHRVLVRLNPYPRPWRAVTLDMHDGARLAAWYAEGTRPRAGAVLMAPGTFQTKDDTTRKRRAIDLWRRLGLSVLILDMRGFGQSAAWPSTVGTEEARDLNTAAEWLRFEAGVERVHLWGESLGGAVSLLAAARPGAEDRFSSVVAWSPFADLMDATLAASRDHARGQTPLGRAYRWHLRLRDRRATDFRAYLALVAAARGVTVDELARAASPALHTERLRVRATVFHATDDPVVPVAHAHRLAETRAPKLDVHILPRGRHLEFDRAAPQWYADVTRALLGAA